jgi:hypothetical protein
LPGWSEGRSAYLDPAHAFPTNDTANPDAPDCVFHQWSWEAFVWAMALDEAGQPRFMSLKTPHQLFGTAPEATGRLHLKLAQRPVVATGSGTESAGAIVQADGNMLIAPNGHPVYASVHMNDSYFGTVQRNLIATGAYQKNPDSDYFDVGAAVFKATWLRLEDGQRPPKGAFVTTAEVPVLTVYRTKNSLTVAATQQNVVAYVALVGLHVVGYTENHPEFLWGTFEHQDNSPTFPDNTFDPTSTESSSRDYTFYQKGTPWNHINYNQGNQAAPFLLNFDLETQKFKTVTVPNNNATGTYDGTSPSGSPGTNVVLANKTGGEANTNGVPNVENINEQARAYTAQFPKPQNVIASYFLGGTVWMNPNSYSITSTNKDARGSVNLANTTAETFFQTAKGQERKMFNCFLCHNAKSFSFQTPPPAKLTPRRVAISHMVAEGSPYAVPNLIPIRLPEGSFLVPKTE